MCRAQRCATRSAITVGALLLATTLLLVPVAVWPPWVNAQPSAPPPGIEVTTLATRVLHEAPQGRRWVLRRGHPLNEDAHAHAGGFIYAASGRSYLIVEDGQGQLMEEGGATWAPGGIGHLHCSPFRASSSRRTDDGSRDVWTILLESETEAHRPGAAATSPPLRGILPGAYEARLVSVTYQPGAGTGVRHRTGPELAYTLDGLWELEYAGVAFALGADQGYFADPGVPHRLRNIGSVPARLLSAHLVPAGQPAEAPVP